LSSFAAAWSSAACSFDSGHDYAVTVTWLINGTAPSEELCDAQGVERVRFTVRSPSKRRTLEASCDDRVVLASDGLPYGGFITTQSFDYGVAYDYEVEMLDRAGNPLPDLGYGDTFVVYYGDEVPWALAPLELWDPGRGAIASVFGSWTINGRPPDATSCAAVDADEVAIEVASSTDADFADFHEVAFASCADGELDSREAVLAEGEYVARYVLFSADDTRLQEIPLVDGDQLISHHVFQAGELPIDPVDFRLSNLR
jgi:hypothetical protein